MEWREVKVQLQLVCVFEFFVTLAAVVGMIEESDTTVEDLWTLRAFEYMRILLMSLEIVDGVKGCSTSVAFGTVTEAALHLKSIDGRKSLPTLAAVKFMGFRLVNLKT